MRENRAPIIIFVGLGGTGSAIVENLYKKFPKDKFGLIIYDADVGSQPEGFPDYNYVPAVRRREEASRFCKDCMDSKKYPNFSKAFRQYWPGAYMELKDKCAKLGYFDATGLGQIRPKGFLGFLKHVHDGFELKTKIENEIKRLAGTDKLDRIGGIPEIRIICSFAGGTGSGTFLDLSFLLKSFIPNCRIVGYFILGGAAMRGRGASEYDYKRTYANTYGAFQELKKWFGTEERFNKIYGEAPELKIRDIQNPFYAVYLIDDENEAGKYLKNHKEYEKLCADCIYDIFMSPNIQALLNNVEQPNRVLSIGRAVLRYPREDILELLGLYFLKEYIEKSGDIIREREPDDIEKQVEAHVNLNFGENNIKNELKTFSRGGKKFPRFPNVKLQITKLMNKKNYQSILKQVDERINESLQEAKRFLDDISDKYFNDKKNKFLQDFQNTILNRELSFAHGYLHRLLNKIEGIKKYCDEDASIINNLNNSVQDLENQKTIVVASQGGKKKENERLFNIYEEYFDAQCEVLLREKIKEFLDRFHDFLKKILNLINFVQDCLKKDNKILGNIRSKISDLEGERTTNYEEYANIIKVMSIRGNRAHYKELYEKRKEQSKDVFKRAEEKIKEEINKIIKKYIEEVIMKKGILDSMEEKNLQDEIKEAVFKEVKGLFKDVIPQNIFEALYHEMKLKGPIKDFHNYVTSILHKLKTEASTVFLQGEKRNYNKNFFLFYDREELSSAESKLGEGFNIDHTFREFTPLNVKGKPDEIICVSIAHGYKLDEIKGFSSQQDEKKYYLSFENLKNHPDPDERVEVFTDARYKPGGLPAKVLFFLAEHFGIIEKQLDKKGKETGSYFFEGLPLVKNVKGRKANLNWFINNEDPQKRGKILGKLRDRWNKIPATERKKVFEEIKEKFVKHKSKVKKEDLRNLYEKHQEDMEEAIEEGYWNIDDITSII